jgi:hypothetical protein
LLHLIGQGLSQKKPVVLFLCFLPRLLHLVFPSRPPVN